jgi:Aminoglycoside N3''-acetyltransferase
LNFIDFQKKDFINHLKKLGLKKDMDIFIHSSLIKFSNIKSPYFLFEALKEIVDKNGTIFFPLFTFRKHGNSIFKKMSDNPNSMGSLSNYIWNNYKKDIDRSNCFIHSYGGYGKNSKILNNVKIDRSYGRGSFFDLAYKKKIFFISFGLNLTLSCTQIHHSENLMKVKYKKKIILKRKYEIDGKTKKVNYYYHRKSKSIISDFSILEEKLLSKNILKKVNLNDSTYSLAGDISKIQNETIDLMKINPLILVK